MAAEVDGHPRFMSLAPWYVALPATGEPPPYPDTFQPLNSTHLAKNQAGDSFELVDVSGHNTIAADIRINGPLYDFVRDNYLYTKNAFDKCVTSFNYDKAKGGIWLPPRRANSMANSIEVKTSWRYFGYDGCPSRIMHCEKDQNSHWWGLTGIHFVQKTPLHGEMIWASFEHVTNAPDCRPGGSNPIQHAPIDPMYPDKWVNVNKRVSPMLMAKTGWSLFDYTDWINGGGSDATCTYPEVAKPNTYQCKNNKAQCLTNPNPRGDKVTWAQVQVCRTDQLPAAADSCVGNAENSQNVSCLNHNVAGKLKGTGMEKWGYYMLIGTEFQMWGAANTGAPLTGCWNFDDGPATGNPKKKTAFGVYCMGYDESDTYREGSVNLANTTMETWMQKNICLQIGSDTWIEQDCFSCHQPTTTSWGQGDMSHIFDRIRQAGNHNFDPPLCPPPKKD